MFYSTREITEDDSAKRSLEDAAVGAKRLHVARLIQEPESVPLIA